ncbi:MAG: hypothetical protein M1832_005421 [Thelocarpon impressellum]|nr:MAG: hypothetical protein M1832_005421 [Thelocarpon impressellum]
MALFSLWREVALCLLVLILPVHAAPETFTHDETFTPDRILRVSETTLSLSCLTQASVVVNGTSPGPELRIPAGKTTWVRVYNDMENRNVTMHWHGLTMSVAPFSDGTPLASQWPIPPEHFFDYELHPEAEDAGTYFYHSHIGFQAVSAAGSLIVEDAGTPPIAYDEEKIIFLTDLFNKTDEKIESGLKATPFVWSGEAQDILVNGLGQMKNCTTPLAMIDLKPATTYRLRVIGATALSFVTLGIQGHDKLEVIEADGSYTKPLATDVLQVGTGQRFSVLLKTKTVEEYRKDREEKKTPYYMQLETRDRPTLTTGYAVIRYILDDEKLDDSYRRPKEPPLKLPPTIYGWLDYELVPLKPNNFPKLSEVTRRVTIKVQQLLNGTVIWAQNGLPWTETFPKQPYLVALYNNESVALPSYDRAIANGGMDPDVRAFPARMGEVLEIVLQNSGSLALTPGSVDIHPFHAHGAHYWNLGSGNGTYNVEENERRLEGTQPVLRDTTMLYRYGNNTTPGGESGWRAWRLRVTQPGIWMIHCHILQHLVMGMSTTWVFGNSTDILKVPKPMVQSYLTYGGSVMGNRTHAPEGVKFFPEKGG